MSAGSTYLQIQCPGVVKTMRDRTLGFEALLHSDPTTGKVLRIDLATVLKRLTSFASSFELVSLGNLPDQSLTWCPFQEQKQRFQAVLMQFQVSKTTNSQGLLLCRRTDPSCRALCFLLDWQVSGPKSTRF